MGSQPVKVHIHVRGLSFGQRSEHADHAFTDTATKDSCLPDSASRQCDGLSSHTYAWWFCP